MDDLLQKVFNTPEEAVKTFADVLASEGVEHVTGADEIVSGETKMVQAPSFTLQRAGFIDIRHGWHKDDYVWHIAPAHPKRPWKVSMDRVIFAIAQTLREAVPASVYVKIWLPSESWEIKELTFKAIALRGCWNVEEKAVQDNVVRLFDILNPLV